MNYWDEDLTTKETKEKEKEEGRLRKFWARIRRSGIIDKFKEKRAKQVLGMVALSLIYALLICPQVALADGGAASVTASFNTLKDIVVALVTSVGTIVLLWGFFEWGTSLQSQEGVMQANAFKRIGGGLVMVLAPQLITAFVS